tara:strand:+ start:234 stop:968 length:735 start_codon:yes stop_codon:yes gene_type:complete
MSNFVFILILFFFNSILLIALILSSINKKSPRRLLKFLFMPILLSLFISLAIQFQLQISEITLRQLFVNLIVILWCLKSFSSYKSIKATLLKDVLQSVRDSIYKKKFFTILFTVLKISLIQIICFSSVFSLNYLSGYSSLNYLDILGISLCILGISIEITCERQIKNARKRGDNLITTGLWNYLRHPNLVGLLLMFSGLHVLALSGVGSQWSLLGLMVTISIIYKKLIPRIEGQLLTKYPEYHK